MNTLDTTIGQKWRKSDCVKPRRYYVHKFQRSQSVKVVDSADGKWAVIDSETGMCVTGFWKTKRGATGEFVRKITQHET